MSKSTGIGKRGEYRALEIMEIGKAVTPSEIDAHVANGAYSSKYMSFLKRDGFVIQVNKDGRSVVSYTLISKPDDAKLPRGAFDRTRKAKVAKVKAAKPTKAKAKVKAVKPTKVKVKPVVDTSENLVLPAKKVAAKKAPKVRDIVEDTFADNGETNGGSFSVDSGFDDFDPRELA